MKRFFYSDIVPSFLARSDEEILGRIVQGGQFSVETTQRDAWRLQIGVLRRALAGYAAGGGKLYFEYSVPRLGKRIDVIAILGHVVFVIEFKVGETAFTGHAIDQVWDYALDLKNFHESTHHRVVAPIVVATNAKPLPITVAMTRHRESLIEPIRANPEMLPEVVAEVLGFTHDGDRAAIVPEQWEVGRYRPTPTIVEAATVLWRKHHVHDIEYKEADFEDVTRTAEAIDEIIRTAKRTRRKAICFVTGVPGAGKTLVGLDVANRHTSKDDELYSVFLSGNGPLVAVLREALARDEVQRRAAAGEKVRKADARRAVNSFIQPIHHFRDEYREQKDIAPPEHVVLFDEAQRAWDHKQTANFMMRRRGVHNFPVSEPEFLISCMDRHPDWAVVVCLVGGGQEINTGEAGISEWIEAIERSFKDWHIYISPHLHDSEYGAGKVLQSIEGWTGVHLDPRLHLSVSMRSFRAERISAFVKALLDHDKAEAQRLHASFKGRYPIVLTRSLQRAKAWLRERAHGSERYGIVVSSQAERLKPHAIDVRSPMDPIHWFLGPKDDVRSSYYLEDVATEFHVQGLELDWAAVVWDGDFRWDEQGWRHFSFRGNKWQRINQSARQAYLKNAYRVLLTRARQGMVIVVPEGDAEDPTRAAEFYDQSFEYLKGVGLTVL